MKFAVGVTLYNPTEQIFDNISTYINGVEKLYIFDNGSTWNIYDEFRKKNYFSSIALLQQILSACAIPVLLFSVIYSIFEK